MKRLFWLLALLLLCGPVAAQTVDPYVRATLRHGAACDARADVLVLMMYGQSWSVGGGRLPLSVDALPGAVMWPEGIEKGQATSVFGSTVPLRSQINEVPVVGASEMFLALWNRDCAGTPAPLVHAMLAGQGGAAITVLQKGFPPYTSLIEQITEASNLYAGMTVRVVILFAHGDSNAYDTQAAYEGHIQTLRADLLADIGAITGQATLPFFASQNALSSWRGGTDRTHIHLHDTEADYHLVGPLYAVQQNDLPLDGNHPDQFGYYEMGLLFGAAAHEVITQGYATTTPLRLEDVWHEPGLLIGFASSPDGPVAKDTERVMDPGTAGIQVLSPPATITIDAATPPNSNQAQATITGGNEIIGTVFFTGGNLFRITGINGNTITYFPRSALPAGPVEVIHGGTHLVDSVDVDPSGLVTASYQGDASGGQVQTGFQSADGQTGRGPGYGMQSNVTDSRREAILARYYHPSGVPYDVRRLLIRERAPLAFQVDDVPVGSVVWDARVGQVGGDPSAWYWEPVVYPSGAASDWRIEKSPGGGPTNKHPLPPGKSPLLGRGLFELVRAHPQANDVLHGPSVPVAGDGFTFCAVAHSVLGFSMGSADGSFGFSWEQGGLGASGMVRVGEIVRSSNHIPFDPRPLVLCFSVKAHADPDSAFLHIRSNHRQMQTYTGLNALGQRTAPSTLAVPGALVGARTLRMPWPTAQLIAEIRILPQYLAPDELERMFQRLVRRWGVPAVP